MRIISSANLLVAGLLSFSTAHAVPSMAFSSDQVTLDNATERQSYSIGVDIGSSLKMQSLPLSIQHLLAGLEDSYQDRPLALSESEIKDEITQLQKTLMEKQMAEVEASAKTNLERGERFLSENASKSEVNTLKSGVQYEVITEGAGALPKSGDTVKVHYRGTLVDGAEFDSSYARGEPSLFPVTGVIPGLSEALQIMPVGSTWRIAIPANLAYGEFGVGNVIGPNEALVFEVELIAIEA